MPLLKLEFTGSPRFELIKSEYRPSSAGKPCCAVRGKTSGAHRGYNTFQWTSAVQALSLLFLRLKVWALQGCSGAEPLISGEGGSPAASLDYALGKQPEWLCEMFGTDPAGSAVARRLFRRTNPERKRGGPVSIGLNSNLLAPDEIRIFLDDAECLRPGLIIRLADAIEKDWHIRTACQNNATGSGSRAQPERSVSAGRRSEDSDKRHVPPFNRPSEMQQLHAVFVKEITWGLRSPDIFSPSRFSSTLKSIASSATLKRISNGKISGVTALAARISNADRLGGGDRKSMDVLRSALQASPLTISIPPAMTACVAIFTCLEKIRGYGLKVDYMKARAIDIVNAIINGPESEQPDACVTGIASTATLMSYGETSGFTPLLLMPKLSYCVAGPARCTAGKAALNRGIYRLVTDSPAAASLYFDLLLEEKLVGASRVEVVHSEADEATLALIDNREDTRAILCFPMHYFCQKYAGAKILHDSKQLDVVNETMLFAGPALTSNPALQRGLLAAVRDTWLSLREDQNLLSETISLMLQDVRYVRYLARLGGLHHMLSE